MSPELRVEVTFLMTFSSVNPVKIGDGHNMEAVEQAGECLFPDTKVSQMRGGRRAFLKLLHTVMEPAGLYGCEQNKQTKI